VKKRLEEFMKDKKKGDKIFGDLTPKILSKYLRNVMGKLTAKVSFFLLKIGSFRCPFEFIKVNVYRSE